MYLLMNKDREVARFSVTDNGFGDTYSFQKYTKEHLPIGFDYIEAWLNNRKASKHNAHLRQIMKDCGCDRTEGFIRVTHAASINDTFWVKEKQEDVHWQDVSFFRNEFNKVISKLAFEGIGLYGIKLSNTSPELSTDGSFRKCWMREAEGIYLYKRGSSGARNAGLEPYCEILGAEIAGKLLSTAVSYELVNLHGEPASKCRLFTDEQYGYVPAVRFDINHSSPSELMQFYSGLGNEDAFRRMIVIDSLTFNVDRHAGNHGVLVDNDTLQPVTMAPVFDMNMSMLPYVERDEFQDINRKMNQYGPRIGEDFTRMGQQAVTSAIRSDMVGLKGFQFTFRGDEQFPEWRVKAMEELVNRQIEAVLSKDILYTKDVFVPQPVKDEKKEENPCEKEEMEGEEQKAAALAVRIMKSGLFLGYDIETRQEHQELIFFLKSGEYEEIRVRMDNMECWAEIQGSPVSLLDCIFSHQDLSEALDCVKDITNPRQEIETEEEEIDR